MELIERYVYAVTKRLPAKQSEDIKNELRSLIEDMLSERCGANAPQPSDVESVLTELGDPSKLAAKYRDEKSYLIGPEYFSFYLFLLKIVIAATAFGTGLAAIIALLVNPPASAPEGIANVFGSVISGAFQGFAWVTIIFAVVERAQSRKSAGLPKMEWHVSDLPEIPNKQALIKPADPIISIVFSVLFLIFIIYARQIFGIYYADDNGVLTIIPIFSERILLYIPLFIALLACSVVKDGVRLIVGKWNLVTGISAAVINIVLLCISVFIFSDRAIWNGDIVSQLYASNMAPADLSLSLNTIWNGFKSGILYVIIFGYTVDSIVSLVKGIKYGR